ncbi:hypothetical protein DH2020_011071 [Rehmannia glutinosa]|uniref:serine C-palmitoyltransferase n=1 Tax=Rehmannia glutinosa TaxID=99300 RepID=A0ABR0XD04_REHGL
MDTMFSAFETMVKSVSDWVTLAFDRPSARAIVFGVPIKGHLLVEGLLFVVILFLLSQKSYKPPKRPLTKKEVDELCDEWVPEPLIPSITEEMKYEPPVLESAAGPHTVINGKDVVNFTSADYLGLLGHDKLQSLQSILENVTHANKRTKKLRRYIVVEAVYQIENVDIVTAAMGHALATEGGFCTGSARVIDHQRLSSSGYVFSASLPPYLASAAITAIDVLEGNPNLITKLKENIATLRKGLLDVQGFEIVSDPESPIVFLTLKKSTGSIKGDLQVLQDIADHLLKEHSIFVATSKRSTVDKCKLPAGIRLYVSAAHTKTDLEKACESFKKATAVVLADQ